MRLSLEPSYICFGRSKTNQKKSNQIQTTKTCNVICNYPPNAEKILNKFIHPQAPDVLNFSLNKKKCIILVQGFFLREKN